MTIAEHIDDPRQVTWGISLVRWLCNEGVSAAALTALSSEPDLNELSRVLQSDPHWEVTLAPFGAVLLPGSRGIATGTDGLIAFAVIDERMVVLAGAGTAGEHLPVGVSCLVIRPTTEKVNGLFSWADLKRFRRPVGELLVFSAVTDVVAIAVPFVVATIIDKVIAHHDLVTLSVLGGVLVGAVVVEALLTALKNQVFAQFSTKILAIAAGRLFGRLLVLPVTHFGREALGTLTARMREMDVIQAFFTDTAIVMVVDLIFLAIFMVFLVSVSPLLTLGALAFVALVGLASAVFSPQLESRYDRSFAALSRYQALLVEMMGAMESVKTLGLERSAKGRLETALAHYLLADYDRRTTGNVLQSVVLFITHSGSAFIIIAGCWLVIAGTITLGQLVAFHLLFELLQAPLQRLAQLLSRVNELRVAFRQVGHFFSAPTEGSPHALRSGELRPPIRLEDVTYQYDGADGVAVAKISVELPVGGTVAIVGASGCGKSTLAKLIGGLLTPSSGIIYYDNTPHSILHPEAIRAAIAHAGQDAMLFAGTVAENLAAAAPGASLDKIMNTARLTAAHDFVCSLPGAYLHPIHEKGRNLSGGQRQRLIMAREALRDTPIFILDEASNAVDSATQEAIFDALLSAVTDRLLIFVTHDLLLAERADVVLHMVDGALGHVERRCVR